jgi:phosphate:Na+ symporter
MDWQFVIVHALGGLGMFLYGMTIMSNSLKRLAGERMKAALAAVSTNRVLGCLTGVGVTAVIQSSSATTVMLVGFVNAGLMTTVQAVGVAMGAHIGTTMTAQILAFNISGIALPCIAAGTGLWVLASSRNLK